MKTRKILICVAVVLLIAGIITCSITFASKNFDLRNVNTEELITNTYTIEDSFDSIDIDVDTADVVFEKAGDGKCRVECLERKSELHDVKVESGKLKISVKPVKNSFHFSFGYVQSPKITVYITNDTFDSIKIKTDTGDTEFGDISAENIDLSSDTGDIRLLRVDGDGLKADTDTGDLDFNEISVGSLDIKTDTGDVRLAKTVATGDYNIKTDTGDISFDGCDAANLYIKSDTGDVSGTLLKDKEFVTKSDTGDEKVPSTAGDGKCEITTQTGDINISIKK